MKVRYHLAAAFITLLAAGQSFGEVVYETLNTNNIVMGVNVNSAGFTQLAGNATAELGDTITLGGTGRTLVSGSTRWVYYGGPSKNSPTYTSDLKLSFYDDLNSDGLPDSSTPFYSQDIVGPTVASGSVNTAVDVSWLMPDVVVPNSFIFTFHMNDQDALPYDSDSNVYGPRARVNPNQVGFDTAPVGTAGDYVWRQNGSSTFNHGAYPFLNPGNVWLVLNAAEVPEPSSIVLGGLGVVGFAVMAYRRKRRSA